MPEPGQKLPEVPTHSQSGLPESSKAQEEIETMSIVTETPTSNSGGTSEPTIDHTPITTDLRSYEVVIDENDLEQKVSDVSTSVQLLTVYQCLNPPRREIRNLQGM